MAAGVAYGEDGVARGAMGADAADYDRSGRPHLLVGNFSNQMLGLYHNEGNGLFVDEAPSSTRRPRQPAHRSPSASSSSITIWTATPISSPPTATSKTRSAACSPRCSYQRAAAAVPQSGQPANSKTSARQWARLSPSPWWRAAPPTPISTMMAISTSDHHTNNGPAYLFRNDGGNRNHWLHVRLAGTKSNRDGIGAVVRVESACGKQWNMVRSGSSYCSQSDLALTFGLGKTPK